MTADRAQKKGDIQWLREKAAVAVEAGPDFETPESRRLCETISAETDGVCILGFSRGKDSVDAWLHLRRFFKRVIPFHCASVPHLRWVDDSLAYYENYFRTPIYRYMHERAVHAIGVLVWQPPGMEEEIDAMELH